MLSAQHDRRALGFLEGSPECTETGHIDWLAPVAWKEPLKMLVFRDKIFIESK